MQSGGDDGKANFSSPRSTGNDGWSDRNNIYPMEILEFHLLIVRSFKVKRSSIQPTSRSKATCQLDAGLSIPPVIDQLLNYCPVNPWYHPR